MATEFISNSWLMPENSNQDRVSNYSLNFDGSAKINYSTPVDLGVVSTFSFWMNIDVGTTGALFGNTLLGTYEYVVYYAGSAFYFKIGGSYADFPNAATAINTGQWHHVAFVRPSENEVKCYIDSVLTDTITSWSGTPGSNPIKFDLIGSRPGGGLDYSGKITEISGFDYALSSSQVTQLYGTGSAIGNPMAITNGRKPVAYYPLGNAAFNGEFLVPNGAEQDYVFDFIPNGYINCGTSSSLKPTSAYSISGWFKLDDITGTKTIISNDSNNGYMCWVANDKLWFYHYDTNWRTISSTTRLVADTWYHFALTWGLSSTTGKMYINGVYENQNTGFGQVTYLSQPVYIGTYSPSQYFKGNLSNISIFNTTLPAIGAESVESLYNYGTPPNIASYSNLQGWWELDASATFDGSNWSIPDASGNSNTGTSSGMTAANLILSDLVINQPYDSFSLDYDGTNQHIDLTSDADLGINSTVSLWLNSDLAIASLNDIILGYNFSYLLYINNNLIYVLVDGNLQSFNHNSMAAETWYNITIVRTGDSIEVFQNGVSLGVQTGYGTSVNTIFNQIAARSGGGFAFNGKISNLSTFNTALSSAQVKTLYNEHKPFDLNNFEVTPTNWWRLGSVNSSFDGTNWTVLNEISTSGNNGVSENMTQADLVSGVGATGSGTSSGMSSGTNRTGDAPYSASNSVSYNMSVTAKSTSVPT